MTGSRLSLKRSLLLSTIFSLTLFTAGSIAADTTTTDAATTTDATDTDTAATTAAATTTEAEAAATTTSSSDDGTTSMPGLSTSTTESANSAMPTLSSTSAADSDGTAIPTYPAPSVPPTSNAPYMQTSSMPDGTVFIAVGAILGAFGLAILLWRAVVACLLHRSVEKAAMAQHLANDKSVFPTPPAPFYKYSDHESGSAQNVVPGRGVRRTTRGPVPSATPSQTNLFFSPTAGAGPGPAPGANPRESVYRDAPNRDSSYRDSFRDSRFLPAGFYAAGQSSPHNVDAADGSSISLNNLRPDSRGHARASSAAPGPDSPGFGPSRSPLGRDLSSSSVSLNAPADGRAPSAYLDDLLAENPEMFPPPGNSSMPPSAHQNHQDHPYRNSGRF